MIHLEDHPAGLLLDSPAGNPRAYVDPKTVDGRPVVEDLWVMQGSLCDLNCTHCYVNSSPRNGRLEQIRFDELQPHLEEAARFGVRRIYFTGGEPFVNEEVLRGRAARNEDFLANLAFALEIAPVDVLTNGRRYIRNHFEALEALRRLHGDRLRLRITLESPERDKHDTIRGKGTFDQTVSTIRDLANLGFVPVIAAERPLLDGGDDELIRDRYRALFDGIEIEVNLIGNMISAGRELVRIGAVPETSRSEVFVTPNCFSALGKSPDLLMCHYSRCIQKVDGALRYYPCPVIYDEPAFCLGESLEESLRRVYLAHKNCYDYCLKGRGASCRTSTL